MRLLPDHIMPTYRSSGMLLRFLPATEFRPTGVTEYYLFNQLLNCPFGSTD